MGVKTNASLKFPQSVFRVTTFFQFKSTKAALDILLYYVHDFNENLKTLYPKSVTNNNFDHKSYDVRQYILTYSSLLKLCSGEFMDCKLQIMQLTSQVNNIFATEIKLAQNVPKEV